VALVTTDISEERTASIIMVTRIREVGKILAEAISSSETSVLTKATGHDIPKDGVFQATHVHVYVEIFNILNIYYKSGI
jgi:hypothetical protein